MERIVITDQDILNARSHIPLTEKWVLACLIAGITPKKTSIAVKENGKESIPLPDMIQRRTMMETQFKIGVFVKEYLGKDFEPVHDTDDRPVPYLMPAEDADAWGNFEAQLDRLKRSKTPGVADKCYDILNDYHAFLRMVSIEIEQELQIKNDLLGRMAWFLSSLVSKFTMEELQKNLKELSEMAEKGGVEHAPDTVGTENAEETGENGHIAEDEKTVEG